MYIEPVTPCFPPLASQGSPPVCCVEPVATRQLLSPTCLSGTNASEAPVSCGAGYMNCV